MRNGKAWLVSSNLFFSILLFFSLMDENNILPVEQKVLNLSKYFIDVFLKVYTFV